MSVYYERQETVPSPVKYCQSGQRLLMYIGMKTLVSKIIRDIGGVCDDRPGYLSNYGVYLLKNTIAINAKCIFQYEARFPRQFS